MLDYPYWFILLCLLLGAVYAFIFYYRERKLEGTPVWMLYGLYGLRFVTVSVLAILLLGPLVKNVEEQIEKPIIIVGHDNSASILLNADSTFYRTDYARSFNAFVNRLSEAYTVETYSFGTDLTSGLALSFDDKQSDISRFLDEIQSRFYGRNVGAVVVASDGIYNKGFDPVSTASGIVNTGIYSVALGDTTVQKDLIIEKVEHNDVAYLGNEFPVEVLVKADKLKGVESELEIIHNGKVLFSKAVNPDQSAYLQPFSFRIEADKAGLQKYIVRLKPVDEEFSLDNNTFTFFVNVQNNKQKVLIVGHGPHPDIGAIRNAVEDNEGYQVDIAFAGNTIPAVGEYGLIILHQIPSSRFPLSALLTEIQNKKKPVLFVLGYNSGYKNFNDLKTGLTHIGFRGIMDPRTTHLVNAFSLFTMSDKLKEAISRFPVMHVPFGTFKSSNSVDILLKQKLGGGITDEPAIAFNRWAGVRIGFISGEGTWRWRIAFPDEYNELMQKTVQYLATKEDKRYFRILGKKEFNENEDVIFEAEVFNESYELINAPEVTITITDEEGEDLPPLNFATVGNGYQLNVGNLPVGKYTYQAETTLSGKSYKVTGEFSVSPVLIEYANAVANHQLLFNLADKNGGEMVFPNQLDELYEAIMSREDLLPIRHTQTRFSEIIEWKWLFFLLIFLLSLEWFIRKRNGAY